MNLSLEQMGKTIGEHCSSLINYGLFLTHSEDLAQKFTFETFFRMVKSDHSFETSGLRVYLFRTFRQIVFVESPIQNLLEKEEDFLFLLLCENFSIEETKEIMQLRGDYWDQNCSQILFKMQRDLKLSSSADLKLFFTSRYKKHKQFSLSDRYQEQLSHHLSADSIRIPLPFLFSVLLIVGVVIVANPELHLDLSDDEVVLKEEEADAFSDHLTWEILSGQTLSTDPFFHPRLQFNPHTHQLKWEMKNRLCSN